MQFPHAWELGGRNPTFTLEAEYFRWLRADTHPERMQSAVRQMQEVPPGFDALHVAVKRDESGVVLASKQIDVYSNNRGNKDGHTHSRKGRSALFPYPGTRFEITHFTRLHPDFDPTEVTGFEVDELQLVINNVVDIDGRRPRYNLTSVGTARVRKSVITGMAYPTWQESDTLAVHVIDYYNPNDQVSFSVYDKGSRESPQLSTRRNLVLAKGLTEEEAEQATADRNEVAAKLDSTYKLGPATLIYAPPDRDDFDNTMDSEPVQTDPRRAEQLLIAAHRTAELLARQFAV